MGVSIGIDTARFAPVSGRVLRRPTLNAVALEETARRNKVCFF